MLSAHSIELSRYHCCCCCTHGAVAVFDLNDLWCLHLKAHLAAMTASFVGNQCIGLIGHLVHNRSPKVFLCFYRCPPPPTLVNIKYTELKMIELHAFKKKKLFICNIIILGLSRIFCFLCVHFFFLSSNVTLLLFWCLVVSDIKVLSDSLGWLALVFFLLYLTKRIQKKRDQTEKKEPCHNNR